ncbi:MAG TPA: insulinase family protein [Phenylobacterium sp.]|nr:insulinase family protein [Phenylobacterium sp.]
MIRFPRAGLALAALVSVLVFGQAPASIFHQTAKSAPAAAARPGPLPVWPQAHSDVPADPAIRFGTLSNGMRFAIRRQTIPAGEASLRLWFDAGSLMETDAQRGLAHFLEHMAFNGSKAVPEGDMVKILERLGLAFGADTNASTSFDETIYKLDLPHTDDETVDTSLMLLRQTAGELTIDPAAVDRERGVVLSEERSRDSPSYRVYKARLGFWLAGQRMPNRYPIGHVDVLKTAPARQIADFYRRYYRPERAVIVAVGDFDPAAMETKIRAKFGDWQAQGPSGTEPDLGKLKPRKTEARLVVEPGAPLSLQIAWLRPYDTRPESVAKHREELIQQLGFAVLNRRFSAIARSPEPPFIGAASFKTDLGRSAEVTLVNVGAEPDQWRVAMAAAIQEQRRAVRYGVRQDELDREIQEVRASMKAALAGAGTRRPAELANEIVGSLSDNQVVTSPADDLAFFEAAVKGLKADTVSAALKTAFVGQGPLVFMTSPKPVEGGDQALLTELASAEKLAIAAPGPLRQVTWPYESFGEPGKVVETRDVLDLDTVFLRFGNGVRLTVKPTKFRDDEVLVRVNIGEGLKALPKDRQSLAWFSGAFIEGGLKQIDNEDTERVLASKVYGAGFAISEDSFVLSGATRTEDLPTQMQVLAAYASDPGWRSEAFQRRKASGKTVHDQMEATDSGVLGRELSGLLHRGDRRFTFPSREDIAQAQLPDLQAQIAAHLANDPIEVVVVGDISVEKAIEAVARTFGALPPRNPAPPVPESQKRVGFPDGVTQPVTFTHKGRADQAIGYMAWPTTDYWANPQRALDTDIMGEIMQLRLIDELREAQGATYSPSVRYLHSTTWTGWGYLAASVEVPPQKLAAFFADAQKIAVDLRTKPVSADELERAKTPRIDRIQRSRLTNQYWLADLSGAQADPRRLDSIRQILPGTERVSAADVERAAQFVLKDDRAFRIVVEPAKK